MQLKRLMTGFAALSLGVLVAGCSSSNPAATIPATTAQPAATIPAATAQPAATGTLDTEVRQTLNYAGIVSNVDVGGTVVVQTTQSGDVACNTSEDTVFVNAVTGREASLSDVRVGTYVSVTLSPAMTRSVPPQAACYAMILDIPQDGLGSASYLQVSSVSQQPDGSIQVTNQNEDTIVTIPADIPIERLGSDETVAKDDIVKGSRLVVWYDAVTLSLPAKATALRAVYCS